MQKLFSQSFRSWKENWPLLNLRQIIFFTLFLKLWIFKRLLDCVFNLLLLATAELEVLAILCRIISYLNVATMPPITMWVHAVKLISPSKLTAFKFIFRVALICCRALIVWSTWTKLPADFISPLFGCQFDFDTPGTSCD